MNKVDIIKDEIIYNLCEYLLLRLEQIKDTISLEEYNESHNELTELKNSCRD